MNSNITIENIILIVIILLMAILMAYLVLSNASLRDSMKKSFDRENELSHKAFLPNRDIGTELLDGWTEAIKQADGFQAGYKLYSHRYHYALAAMTITTNCSAFRFVLEGKNYIQINTRYGLQSWLYDPPYEFLFKHVIPAVDGFVYAEPDRDMKIHAALVNLRADHQSGG